MNIGILTAGGVCPGVNTLIRSITLREKNQGNKVYGFSEGFKGLNENINEYFEQRYLEDGPGTILRTSYDYVDLEKAVETLRHYDRLYCICGNESMKSARDLALDDRVNTNIIGVAKTVFNDIHGLESIGFQTAVQELARYIDCAYIEATSTNSIVFLVAPGRHNSKLAIYSGLARSSKITSVITPDTANDHLTTIEYGYATNGYAVVVISEMCDYQDLFTSLSVEPKVITPGYLIRDVEPCIYDSILGERMIHEAFDHAQIHRDFIKGATSILPFKDYLRIV
jgi:6-phosphofructokinase